MSDLTLSTVYPLRAGQVYTDTAGSDPVTVNKPTRINRLRHLTFYMGDADNNDLFPTPPGCVAVAWQPVGTTHKTTATIGATGIIFTGAANSTGWLHCLCNGTLKTGSTTSDAPVAQGTSGHTRPASTMFESNRAASPNTLTSGKHVNKLGLKLKVFEIAPTTIVTADVWLNESGGLCPGIVAVAAQCNGLTDDLAVTQRANGDVVMTITAQNVDYIWLWCWVNRA